MFAWLKKWLRRSAPPAMQVAPDQWARVEAQMPFLGFLDEDERRRLREMALSFLGGKALYGGQGLALSDDACLAIALQACLPVLNLGLECYAGWVEVIVYPGEFVVPRSVEDEAGVVHEYDDVISGEAWEGGPVVLSWPQEGDSEAGINVVIHEFVHKLDMLNGTANGLPPLHAGMSHAAWKRDFSAAFDDFVGRFDVGGELPLDPYAAEHPAEFFAVACEAFFVDPKRLLEAYPAVYRQLARYYRREPIKPDAAG